MLRRLARQRREYIYKKSIEDRERTILEKKQKLKRTLDENKTIPSDLRDEAISLQKTLDWEDEGADGLTTHVDDEYKWAGVEDPKIMITTSRDPSSKLKQFAKEIRLIFPNSQRINRGNYEVKQLVDACRANDVTDLILLHEHRGVPDGLVVSHLPYGPTAYFNLSNVVMRHDIPDVGTMSEAFPHLIFHNFSSKLGNRIKSILKYLFPVPKEDTKRVVTFANDNDFISFSFVGASVQSDNIFRPRVQPSTIYFSMFTSVNKCHVLSDINDAHCSVNAYATYTEHHTYKKTENGRDIEIKEVGPRFEMKSYQIILGTIETADSADVEWVYRPYMNTTKKRRFLTDD